MQWKGTGRFFFKNGWCLFMSWIIICSLSSTGSPTMVTVDGSVFEALLSNMIPSKTYQVTVTSVKGLEESDPSTDTVTTGCLSSSLSQNLWVLFHVWGHFSWHVHVCTPQLWIDLRVWLHSISLTRQVFCCGNHVWPLLTAMSLLTVQIQVCFYLQLPSL